MNTLNQGTLAATGLSPAQTLARIRALRRALDLLTGQQWRDPGQGYHCLGEMTEELRTLEAHLGRRDRVARI